MPAVKYAAFTEQNVCTFGFFLNGKERKNVGESDLKQKLPKKNYICRMQILNNWLVLYAGFSMLLIGAYLVLIARYLAIWKNIPIWEVPDKFVGKTKVSILVPARNEAANIENCLQSIALQKYPKALLEIFVIDDFSTDETPILVEKFSKKNGGTNVKLLKLVDHIQEEETQSFKKKALEIAIAEATGDLIITTDADCVAAPNWMNLLVSFYEKNDVVFIAAPVNFYQGKKILENV